MQIVFFSSLEPQGIKTLHTYYFLAKIVRYVSSKGGVNKSYTGHSAIVYKNKVIDIHPRNKGDKPTYMSFDKWIKDFKTTKVVRYKDSKKASKAGTYACGMATLLDNFYEGCSKAYGAPNQLDMEPLCA
ncbi:MAG: hypothetical protein KBT36_05505 [Kurthia sp.]|nr:hypothetical protein [Candidatus Kurthia equi]